jgi:hypothetical protein
MGLLTLFSRSGAPRLMRLPSGSFTVDRDGRVMTSTLPQSFPASFVKEISACVLQSFHAAQKAQMPLAEIVVHFAALKILARELRGGAIIFLMPQVFGTTAFKRPTTSRS